MRVVFAPDGSRGDVQPMITWAGRLVQSGHDVELCAAETFRGEAEGVGLAFHAYPFDFDAAFAASGDRVVAGGRTAQRALDEMWAAAAESQFRVVPEIAAGADVVIGAGPAMASNSIAEAVGARHYTVAYVPTLLPSSHHPPITMHAPWMPRLINRLVWRLVRIYYNRKLLPIINAHRARLGLAAAPDGFGVVIGRRVICGFDPELAEVPADVTQTVTHVGYLHSNEQPALSPKLEGFLDAGPAPVYIGFGSMTDSDPDATTALISEAAERAGVRVVLGGGWARLGRNAETDRVLVVDHAPHASLFPRCAAAVHHGGAGTTAAAARAGIPQLVIPHLLDQRYWESRVAALELGPRGLTRPRLRVDRLTDRLRDLVSTERYRANAAALGATLRTRDAPARATEAICAG